MIHRLKPIEAEWGLLHYLSLPSIHCAIVTEEGIDLTEVSADGPVAGLV